MALAAIPIAHEWLVVRLYHLFGSEELSVLTPGVAELSPKPYVALNPQDAARLELNPGDPVELALRNGEYRLPARIMPGFAVGVVGLPAGLPELSVPVLPLHGTLRKVSFANE